MQDSKLLNGKKLGGKLTFQNVGLTLVCIYIFLGFVATDIGISSRVKSISLILLLGWAVVSVVRSWKKREFPISSYSAWYFVFVLISFITMMYSPEKDILSGEFYQMLVSFCVTFAITTFVNSKFSFKTFAYTYIISAVVLVVLLYFKGMLSGTESDRLGQELMGNANSFAWMMMIATMFGIWVLIYESGKDSFKHRLLKEYFWIVKVAVAVGIVLCLYALILSGGRKYFVLPFAFLYFLLIFKKDKNGKTHFWLYTLIAIVMVVILYILIMNVEPLYNAIGKRIERFLQGLLGTGNYDGSSSVRATMREYAISMWLQKPIFGYGFDSFKYYNVDVTGHFYYSHCNYTELLFCGGIVLFIVYYGFIFYILKKAIKNKNVNCKYRSFSIAVIVCTLLFDILGISFSVAIMQTFIALAYKVISFKENESTKE